MNTLIFSKEERSFEWLNFFQPDDKELKTLAENLDILPIYIQDILQSEHLPKVEQVGDSNCFFIIARVLDPEMEKKDFNLIHEATRKLAIFLKDDQVISIERGTFKWLEDMTALGKSDQSYGSAFQLVCKLLK